MAGPNFPYTPLDANQVLKNVYDETKDRLRVDAEVTATIGAVECIITQESDSISIGDGTTLFTGTANGPKFGLDVNVINPVTITGAATEATLSAFSNRFTSSTSSITRVASSATSVSILASNSSRKGASFYNESTQNCFLKLGTTASATSYTILMLPGAFFILNNDPVYTGAIDAIWASANGALQITELT